MDKKSLLTMAMDYGHLAGEVEQFPVPTPEFMPFQDNRQRFDWAWPKQSVLVEVHGGTFSAGRHVRGVGFEKDRAKMRRATLEGWTVLEFTTNELDRDPVGCAKEVARALEMPK